MIYDLKFGGISELYFSVDKVYEGSFGGFLGT